jgi:hypothetical protein
VGAISVLLRGALPSSPGASGLDGGGCTQTGKISSTSSSKAGGDGFSAGAAPVLVVKGTSIIVSVNANPVNLMNNVFIDLLLILHAMTRADFSSSRLLW